MRRICFALIAICAAFAQPVFGQYKQVAFLPLNDAGASLIYCGGDGEVLRGLQALPDFDTSHIKKAT